MRLFLSIITLVWSLQATATQPPHPFFVSITELTIEDDTLQISIRVFSDDVETALNDFHGDQVFLNVDQASFDHFKRISAYLQSTFRISHAAKDLKVDWLGHEFEDDVCWIYGDVPLNDDPSILFIMNRMLMNVFDSQQNLIHYNSEDGTRTEIATKSRKEVRFTLD